MYPDVIFQTLSSSSRLMTSHHVTCHVTFLSHAFFIVLKEKKRKIKIKIKSKEKRKIKC